MAALVVVVPLAVAGALVLARRARRILLPLAVGGLLLTLVTAVAAAVTEAGATWRWAPHLELGLAVEGLAAVMAVLVPAVALPVVAFAASSLRHDAGLDRLLALLLAFVAAMLLLVTGRDLLVVLIGWELVAACSWALIGHDWRDAATPSSALSAFLTTRVGDVGLVAAAATALSSGAGTAFADLGELAGWPVHVVAGGILLASAAKSAQVPFAPWLFSAMAGPTPVSALLHSATMVAAGAYLLARTVPVLDGAAWLPTTVAALGLVTALVGGLVALTQQDLKRALAGSTSAQYGLVLAAVGAGSTAAAGAHLVTHAVFKALLFLAAGVVLHASGTLDLGRLRLGRALPFTAGAFAVGALALAAVPPLGGARSKEEILAAASHEGLWLAAGVVVAGFLSAAYAGRLAVLAFGPGPAPATHGGPTGVETAAVGALALATVGLGALWLPGAGEVVERATDGRLVAGEAWELPVSVLALAAAFGLVALLARSGRLLTGGLPRTVAAFLAGWLQLPRLAGAVIVRPVLALSRALAMADDRVVDAGVRLAAALPRALSNVLAWWTERGVDGVVLAVSGGTVRLAGATRTADERAVDRAVEDLARRTGVAGRTTRRLQTGLAHHYYLIAAAGLLAVVAVAVLGR